jgi:2-hydroxy-3-keto-5-methylthiopentenyl-1-phosphate phosphatase
MIGNSMTPKIAIVCDFDGTLTTRDIGAGLARRFADPKLREPLSQKLSRQEISLHELQSRVWPGVKITPVELNEFLISQVELRRGVVEFLEFCKKQRLPFYLVSGGFDFYILPTLKLQQLHPYISESNTCANQGALSKNGLRVQFPHRHPSCNYCSNCKGHFIRELRKQPEFSTTKIIGIGDGISDRCMAREVDQLFACRDLQRFCDKNNLAYTAFEDFHTIQQTIGRFSLDKP